jgi:2-polyprenyl-6-methoxyphenol hydroxylase-like FAD-dependent oxidoreductase
MMAMKKSQVLVIGAGPTGLVLALWLARRGITVRIVDKAAQPGTTSRALVVQARTLELYRELGLAESTIEGGAPFTGLNLWIRGRLAGRMRFSDIGTDLSPFPFALVYPQDDHERLLIARLKAAGVEVERETELTAFEDRGDRVIAHLKRPGNTAEACEAAYLAGCDGAHSKVREILRTGFPGGTYSHVFYVADVEARGKVMNGELHVALDDADFVAVFPLKAPGHARLVGTVRAQAQDRPHDLGWDDVSRRALERMNIQVDRVHWFSSYHVHHRVTEHFRGKRAFLLGDAAHIHSPVGGQGMNTGIGDAINLAWKLAAVLREDAAPALLDSYEPERIAFAQRLVATTDRAFTLVTSDGPIARIVRTRIVPRLFPALFASKTVRRFAFRTVSQTLVNYRAGPLSEGRAGRVRGGDRLPWVPLDGAGDNFAPLTSLDWQVHVYGETPATLREACEKRHLRLHAFPWCAAARRAGLQRGAVYLVRPDGYVGLASADGAALERYLARRGLIAR